MRRNGMFEEMFYEPRFEEVKIYSTIRAEGVLRSRHLILFPGGIQPCSIVDDHEEDHLSTCICTSNNYNLPLAT